MPNTHQAKGGSDKKPWLASGSLETRRPGCNETQTSKHKQVNLRQALLKNDFLQQRKKQGSWKSGTMWTSTETLITVTVHYTLTNSSRLLTSKLDVKLKQSPMEDLEDGAELSVG